jgi:hypothetical protein
MPKEDDKEFWGNENPNDIVTPLSIAGIKEKVKQRALNRGQKN